MQGIYQAGNLPPPPPTLALQNVAPRQLQLTWNYGTLQTATNPAGPYTDLSGAVSPWTISPTNAQQFSRAKTVP